MRVPASSPISSRPGCDTRSVANDKAREALARLFADFERRDDHGDLWEKSEMVGVEPSQLPVPGLVLLLLTQGLGFVNRGIDEKTAWQVPIGFRGHRVTVASQKFGLRLYVAPNEGSEESAEDIGTEVVRRIRKGLQIFERDALPSLVRMQVDAGNLTIANRVVSQTAMYAYFREAAEERFRYAEQVEPVEAGESDSVTGVFTGIEKIYENQEIGSWNAIAAVNAYFSRLEHELVLLLAFTGFDPSGGALEAFIGDHWGSKFKQLFEISSDGVAKRIYDRLHEIAETFRNPYAHGGFDKSRSALWFHLDGIGAVPARLSDVRSSPHFELFPIQTEGFAEICATLDETDAWLREGRFGAAFEWIDSHLDVAYDEESRRQYRRMMEDPEYRRERIARTSHEVDRATNMDW